MASLKQLVTEIIDIVDKPFDFAFYQRVKAIFIHEVAYLIKSESDKKGMDEQWIQYCPVLLKKVDPIDKEAAESFKRIYRSVNPLPKFVRVAGISPLHYVGTADRSLPFMYVTNYSIAIRTVNIPTIGAIPKYSLRDGYLECYTQDANLKQVLVGHAYVNSYSIPNAKSDKVEETLDENDEFLVTEDIIQLAKERVLKELTITKVDDNVVDISGNEKIGEQ